MLLEQYQDYYSRAKMMTEIHAQPSHMLTSARTDQTSCSSSGSSSMATEGGCDSSPTVGKKRPVEKTGAVDKKKRDKKKALKRL